MSQLSISPARRAVQFWPAAAGVALAALTAWGLSAPQEVTARLAPVLAASALVYLGSAVLHRREAAWPMFGATFVVITIGRIADVDVTWVLLGAGVLAALVGLVTAGLRPAHALPLQALGMVAFGAVAAVALLVAPPVGALLVAAGLLGHTAWDVVHLRTGRVVSRTLAVFCAVLDTLLAAAIVVVVLGGGMS